MAFKIIALCTILKMCFQGVPASGHVARIARWALGLFAWLFLLWLFLHAAH